CDHDPVQPAGRRAVRMDRSENPVLEGPRNVT
ncbi:MAG: hypothetical protein ACI9ND_000627, partial [Yoonia sp.]